MIGIRNPVFLGAALIALTSGPCAGPEKKVPEREKPAAVEMKIFPAQVSGTFYPSEPAVLARTVDEFIDRAEVEPIDGRILAIISPHAGYIYSGPVAGCGFRAVKDREYKTVIIIGASHRNYFTGVSILTGGAYRTPLGDVKIDSAIAGRLTSGDEGICAYPEGFMGEHSVENQIPFLQRSLKDFQIVPVLMGAPTEASFQALVQGLRAVIRERGDVLLVASSDMSHYHPYEEAVKIDRLTLETLEKYSPELLQEKLGGKECELCGAAPILAVMAAAGDGENVKIRTLKYANSGDVTGDKSGGVVGYGSLVIYREEGGPAGGKKREPIASEREKKMLNQKQRKRLLEIARSTIDEYLRTGKKPALNESDPELRRAQGAFVTLRRGGELRGCIGNLAGNAPLYLTIEEMAIEAATGDPRFSPMTTSELKEITIEISVLSPMRKVAGPEEIVLGTHGVVVRKGFNSGVFLPQVAAETGWSKEEFLSYLCSHKAGLPPDAWKTGGADLYVFTAEVFDEEEAAKGENP